MRKLTSILIMLLVLLFASSAYSGPLIFNDLSSPGDIGDKTPKAGTFTSVNWAKPANIADSATPAIGAAAGNVVDLDGTTTITGFDTVTAGITRFVTFTGVRVLTYNATSLNLPGAGNITTAVGDRATFISLGSGNWRCHEYLKSDGKPVFNLIASSISDGDLTHSPDGNSVFDALALKAPLSGPTFTGTAAHDVVTFTGSMQLQENAPIILDASLSADGKYSGITETGVAGETLVFGNICYLKASDSRWWLAKADATATSGAVQVGFCVLAANAAGTTTILRFGKINAASLFDTFTISAPVFISAATAGKVVSAAPTGTTNFVVRIVGHANTGDEVFVNISPDYVELL